MLDVVIRGAQVADGSGAPLRPADVGVKDSVITEIGTITDEAVTTIDASGLVVAPGFVDVHTHSDLTLLAEPLAESAVRQGVTTHVFPNCGHGAAPAAGEARQDIEERAAAFGIEVTWRTVGEYFQRVQEARPSINVVPMVSQGSVRMAVMGRSTDAPSAAQLEAMKEHIGEAMRSGARGMCTGLRYVPSGYASVDELVELAKVVHAYGGVYSSHMRSEGDNGDWFAAIDEALAIGQGSGIPVQISHLKALGSRSWGKSWQALAKIEDARSRGIDVTCDQYPYAATSSTLFVLFPQWCQEGGVDAFLARIADPPQEEKIRAVFAETLAMRGGGSRMTVSEYMPGRSLQGKTLSEVAGLMGISEYLASIELLKAAAGRVSMVFHTLEDDDIAAIFPRPYVMVASDGSALTPHGEAPEEGSYPHPRNYGCFPKVLGEFVREKKLVPLEEAVRKMTSLPAARFGLTDRGLIQPGAQADITIFDPATVADMATFSQPQQYPEGIIYVIVNGQVVVEQGKHTGRQPGRVLFAAGTPEAVT
ncbi:MAG TPA: D-aminoacylase [Trebonia sp.]